MVERDVKSTRKIPHEAVANGETVRKVGTQQITGRLAAPGVAPARVAPYGSVPSGGWHRPLRFLDEHRHVLDEHLVTRS